MDYLKLNKIPAVQCILNNAVREIEEQIGIKVLIRTYAAQGVFAKTSQMQLLKDMVCDSFNIKEIDLLSRGRQQRKVNARQVYSFICVEVIGLTLMETAMLLDQDHTTVIASKRKVQDFIDTNDWVGVKALSLIEEFKTAII